MLPIHPSWFMPRRLLAQAVARASLRRQRGQALVFGLFVLVSGLAALFYLFNVGQLIHEKTRLVNTADAVAYSAGLVEARTMNFTAYTNRALVANEVAIAQAVSMASWLEYMESHGGTALAYNCSPDPERSTPLRETLLKYVGTCFFLALAQQTGATTLAKNLFQASVPALMAITELVKTSLQSGAKLLPALSLAARAQTMQEVAKANYQSLGKVEVDHLQNTLLLRDDYAQYGSGDTKRMVIESFTKNDQEGDRRQRMADMAVRSVRMDNFTPERNWSDRAVLPSCLWNWSSRTKVDRTGSTQLVNFDEWRASDQAQHISYSGKVSLSWKGVKFSCNSSSTNIGSGEHSASTGGASTNSWTYSGIPSYMELTSQALQSADPRLLYAVQLRRPLDQTSTAEGRSGMANTPRINPYRASTVANESLYSLSGVEVFFQRPSARARGETELPSLFNPYWQVHLVELPKDIQQKALALLAVQGSTRPAP